MPRTLMEKIHNVQEQMTDSSRETETLKTSKGNSRIQKFCNRNLKMPLIGLLDWI